MSAQRVIPAVVIAALAVGVCVVGLITLAGVALWKAGANCPPADFPRYAGSEQTSFGVSISSVTECDAEFSAPADVAAVTDYMRAQLDSGDWRLVSIDDAQGLLTFERRSSPSTSGQVQVLGRGDHSLLEVQIVT